jgi:hypothetical protein
MLSVEDNLIINTDWHGDNVPDAKVKIKIEWTDDQGRHRDTTFEAKSGDKIPFVTLPPGDITITISAEKDGYVNSDEKVFKVNNFPERLDLTMNVVTVKNWNDPEYPLDEIFTIVNGGGKITEINGKEAVVVAILDPGITVTDEDVASGKMQLKKAVVIDAVGNKVVETSDIGEGEHFKAALAQTQSGKVVLAISWDGKNANGRNVGSGAYKMFVFTSWPHSSDQVSSSLLYVPQRASN